jgi:hypothetical protein
MSIRNSTLTSEQLRGLFHYDPDTGIFTRLKDAIKAVPGAKAGYLNKDGYLQIKINYESHMCQRLAWLYMTNEWPEKMITHANHDRSDNRFSNLIECVRRAEITADLVRTLFEYNPHTGSLTRKSNGRNGQQGDEVGCFDRDGYRQIGLNGRSIRVHRLVWLLVTGEWPSKYIDHINGNRADNRFKNLRDVDNTTNRQNIRKAYRTNETSGLLGVHGDRGGKRFRARITVRGKKIEIGSFRTADEAHVAYLDAKRRLHAGCMI